LSRGLFAQIHTQMYCIGMRILNVDSALEETAHAVRSGGVVVVPTDTVYGIVGKAGDESVVQRVFGMKRRSSDKAVSVFVYSLDMAREYVEIPDATLPFLERVWPGAVTIVLKNKGVLPSVLSGGRETLGMRIPDYEFVSKLLLKVGEPLLQTSANISGSLPARNAKEVVGYFGEAADLPDIVVDGGLLSGISSTVVDATGASPVVLREGSVPKADIMELWEKM
jgi:L-threonylcarbamoyladenylate synthase